jgi:hypothetical protein
LNREAVAKRKAPRVPPTTRPIKAGTDYERVVADVMKAMDPDAHVKQGVWVAGPDGRRDMDVFVLGTVDGKERKVLVECKDFAPGRGPLGIRFVDALDSKRADVGVDLAFLCSNVGFTEGAVRKASRKKIHLIAVMRKGDSRIRVLVPEALYTRQLQVESFVLGAHRNGQPINLRSVASDQVLFRGVPVLHWAAKRAAVALAANPIVNGEFTATHELVAPVTLDVPSGTVEADQIDYRLRISGGWFVQQVTLDASAGLYDWIRHRVRLAPGPSQLHINDVNPDAGDPVERPPHHVLDLSIQAGETNVGLLRVDGLLFDGPVVDLDPLVKPSDRDDFLLKDLAPEHYTSKPR